MTIKVNLFATLRLAVGRGSVEIESQDPLSVRDLIDRVSAAVGQDVSPLLIEGSDIIKGTMILLEGKNIIHLDGLDTRVDVAEVAIFPPAGGG